MSNIALREVVAYHRVSTQLQGVHGLGMAAQREAVRLYGERNGYPIVAAYEEVETGRKDDFKNRPALVAAVAHARRSGALLVIARIDDLARSVFVTSQLLASGVEFVACPYRRDLSKLATLDGFHDFRLGVAIFRRFSASAISRSVFPRLRYVSASG